MATRTISNTGGNWNAVATWVEGIVPINGDAVVATATSGQLTVNVASACTTIDFTNYTNTLTMSNGLTVGGNVTLVTGMTIAGASALTITTTATLTSNTKTWPNALTFNGSSGTITLADAWTVTGTVSTGIANGVYNGFSITIGGGLAATSTMAPGGTTNFILNGTGTWSGAGSIANNLTINTANTITIGSVGYRIGTLTYTAGTVIVTPGSTLSISNGTTLNTNGIIWNNITFTASATHTLTSNLTLSGTWSQNSGVIATINGFQVNVGSVLSNSGAGSTSGTTNFLISGTTNVLLGATGGFKNNLTINSSGTVTITNLVYSVGTLTYTAGTMSIVASILTINGSCTLNTDGILWNNITITLASTITLLSNLSLLGILTFPNAAMTFLGAYTITAPNITTAAITSARIYTFEEGQIWNISTSLKLYGVGAGFKILLTSTTPTGYVTFNLYQGATQDVEFCAATRIDSSLGQTIWSYRTTLTDTLNWNEMSTTPGTISYTS